MTKRRLINFRAFLIVSVGLILATFCVVVFCQNNVAGLIALCILLIAQLAGFIGFYIKEGWTHKPVTFLLTLILTVSTFILGVVLVQNWTKECPPGTKFTVIGTVDSVSYKSGNQSITLEDIRLNGKKHSGKLLLTLTDYDGTALEFAKPGDIISFQSELRSVPLIDGWGADGSAFRRNLRFRAYPSAPDVTLTFGRPSPLQRFTSHLYEVLTKNLGEDYGGIAFSILTGDKNNLDLAISDYYSAAGLGHIMAVSGLHIGFLSGALLWLLDKCRCNKKLSCAIVSAFLIGYLFFADFSPSVVRAVIMCIIGLIAMLGGKQRDTLNSLCFAVSVILAFAPFYLYEAGFILSVTAVLGLILFCKSFFKALRRIKIPKLIANPVSVSTSVQIGILPAMIFLLHNIQLYSILVNVLLIPIIMVGYIAIFLTAMLTCLIPACGIALKIAGIPLAFIDTVAQFVSKLPYAQIFVFGGSALFLCYPLYFLASRFFMLKSFKRIFSLICAGLCVSCIVICDYPRSVNQVLAPVDTYRDVTTVVIKDDRTYIVGDIQNAYAAVNKLVSLRVKRVDAVFVHFIDESTALQLIKLHMEYPLKAVYCHAYENVSGLKKLLERKIPIKLLNRAESAAGFTCVYSGEKYIGFTFDKAPVLFGSYRTKYLDLGIELTSFKIIRASMYIGSTSHIYLTNFSRDYLDLPTADYHFTNMDDGEYLFDFVRGTILI